MKYLYFIWHEGLSSFFNCKVERIQDFKVHVFVKAGDVQPFPLLSKADWYNLHEVNIKDETMLFTVLALALSKVSWYSADELYLLDSNKDRCDDLFQELTSNSSNLKKSLCIWKPPDLMLTFLSFFPNDQVCSKCSIVFDSQYSKRRHEQNRCCHCNELECCGDWGKHEKNFQDKICNSLKCDFISRRCCPKELEHHLKDHQQCVSCKEFFSSTNWYSSKDTFSDHLRKFKECSFCKARTCDGRDHIKKWHWKICDSVKCDHTFALCVEVQNEDHISTHPKCDCGCNNFFLDKEALDKHRYPFKCKDCGMICSTSSKWFEHAAEKDHILLCSCTKCANEDISYYAKGKKMKLHLKEHGKSCVCGNLFFTNEFLIYHKNRCPQQPRVAPAEIPTQIKDNRSETSIASPVASSVAPLQQDHVDEMLAKFVNDNALIVECPIWTMRMEEKENLNILRKQIQEGLSSAKLFQLRVQGSIVKNTAIPAMADFDFILEVRNDSTNTIQVKEEVAEILKKANCQFCYGTGNIETWLSLDEKKDNIFFDVVIKHPGDIRFKDFENNVQMVKTQASDVHSYIRALKYWCKRSNAPLKSFVIEFIGIHLFATCSKPGFTDFLLLLQSSDWIKNIKGLVEPPSHDDLKYLQQLSTAAFNSLHLKR